jgi:alpha-ketoglutarate-dependent taurine dioxygenase
MQVSDLSPVFGSEIAGVDLREELDPQTGAALR